MICRFVFLSLLLLTSSFVQASYEEKTYRCESEQSLPFFTFWRSSVIYVVAAKDDNNDFSFHVERSLKQYAIHLEYLSEGIFALSTDGDNLGGVIDNVFIQLSPEIMNFSDLSSGVSLFHKLLGAQMYHCHLEELVSY